MKYVYVMQIYVMLCSTGNVSLLYSNSAGLLGVVTPEEFTGFGVKYGDRLTSLSAVTTRDFYDFSFSTNLNSDFFVAF